MASSLSLTVNLNQSLKHSQQPLQKSLVPVLMRLQLPKAVQQHRQLHQHPRALQAALVLPAAVVVPVVPVKFQVYQQVLP